MNMRVGKHYQLSKKLGSGAFGDIYLGTHTVTNEEFAVKLEKANAKFPQLHYEAKLYNYFHNKETGVDIGIPRTYYFDNDGQYNVLVMDRLGRSLEDLFQKLGRRFTLKTVLMLAD